MIVLEIKSQSKTETFKRLAGAEDDYPEIGDTYNPIDGVEITLLHGLGDNLSINEWISIGVGLAAGIPLNLLSSYIYDQLKGDTSIKLVINGTEIPLDEKKINEIIKVVYFSDEKEKEDH